MKCEKCRRKLKLKDAKFVNVFKYQVKCKCGKHSFVPRALKIFTENPFTKAEYTRGIRV